MKKKISNLFRVIADWLYKPQNETPPPYPPPLPNGLNLNNCTIEDAPNTNVPLNWSRKTCNFFKHLLNVINCFFEVVKNILFPILEIVATSCLLASIPFFTYQCIIKKDCYHQQLVSSILEDITKHWIGVVFVAIIILYRPILNKIENIIEISIHGNKAKFNQKRR